MPAIPSAALTAPSCIAPPRESVAVLLVQGQHAAAETLVLERLAKHAGARDRPAVVGEAERAVLGELGHLGQLLALEARA